MSKTLSIAIAQINVLVGAITANTDKIIATIHKAAALEVDIIVFPELCLCGYPPEDLLFRPNFHQQIERALKRIQTACQSIDIIIGYPKQIEQECFNVAAWISCRKIKATYAKQTLPNYSVFDEKRYFTAGDTPTLITLKGVKLGLLICEDGWVDAPAKTLKSLGANMLIQLSASPFYVDKQNDRLIAARNLVKKTQLPLLSTQLIGGQDELIFDGGSFALDATGNQIHQSAFFKESLDILTYDIQKQAFKKTARVIHSPKDQDENASLYQALILSVRDYIHKNHFPGVILGLSGGIDSALTLAIAVSALGAKNVEVVLLPSRYTSPLSLKGAMQQAEKLGVQITNLSIEPLFEQCLKSLAPRFKNEATDVTEENMQARCRGLLLMALSNKTGKLVLTTGNKSELAVGYSTLYGDMAGGFDVLKDLYKTKVYDLARYINGQGDEIIPNIVIDRAPSAELKANQTDQDSLPDYAILDAIIKRYMESYDDLDALLEDGFDEATVKRVIKMIKRNEHKRRQAPIGPKLTKSAFGKDWRYPITSGDL